MASLGNFYKYYAKLNDHDFPKLLQKKGTLAILKNMSELRFSTDARFFHPKNDCNVEKLVDFWGKVGEKKILDLPQTTEAFVFYCTSEFPKVL